MFQSSADSIEKAPREILGSRVARAAQNVSLPTQQRILTGVLILGDFLLLGAAFLLAYFARFYLDISFFETEAFADIGYYRQLSLLVAPIWIIVFAINGLYSRQNLLGGTREYALVFRATSFGVVVLVLASFFDPDFILARGWLLLVWGIAFFLITGGRFLIRRCVYALRRRGYFLKPALIVGANKEGRALARQLTSWHTSGLHLLGFVDDRLQPDTPVEEDLNCLGNTGQLDQLINQHGVGELILSNSALSRDELLTLFTHYGMTKGLQIRLSSGLYEIITTGLDVREMAYVPLVGIRKVRLTGLDSLLKLALDYFLVIVSLIFLWPIFLLIALAIRLSSPGPAIYRRRVMGINGRQFDAFKFRTMYVNGDEILAERPDLLALLANDHKLKEDPRVTPVGRFLRRASLDELPQIFNVLLRQMSVVGPRIISPSEMSEYGELGLNLLTVHPGITGLWQVSGRSDVSYEERVRLDMSYIRNWSIWSDLHILLRTVPAVLRARGAY
ncbi:MAG: sugar transferase [Chloroflexota bacterium]|nr:MAG: sugar transferase [Chloroflexota bacterium]